MVNDKCKFTFPELIHGSDPIRFRRIHYCFENNSKPRANRFKVAFNVHVSLTYAQWPKDHCIVPGCLINLASFQPGAIKHHNALTNGHFLSTTGRANHIILSLSAASPITDSKLQTAAGPPPRPSIDMLKMRKRVSQLSISLPVTPLHCQYG